VRRLTAHSAVLQTESAAEDTNNGVIPMLLYLRYEASTSAERTARSVKQHAATLTTANSAGEQCEYAATGAESTALRAKRRVRHHTAYSAEDT
jgi:hypothetical protein